MKTHFLLTITAVFLLVSTLNSAAAPASGEETLAPRGTGYRRPADHWLETIRQDDPGEYRRLQRLRKSEPDAFNAELRQRIQARATERLLEQSPRLRDFLDSLPPEDRESILGAIRRFAGTRRFPSKREDRQDTAAREHPDEFRLDDDDQPDRRNSGKPATRAELESAYDRRTQTVEAEIERISRQLDNLRRMLEERKRKRDRVIADQTRKHQR